ncbi:hypothetical protein H7I93_26050 [Mycobacterium nebraskense]|nr:hypothetical protein WU83_04355 [Mycobacterium nebraskense]KLO34758.1 hypothetical protein ABW17_25315 [Mycobacterium nebraskense]MBI2696754.1 hypothetical protein [Mycobacterium nebraskense]MCV7120556.1 hypothetical protein [Mycobacterium nebraskense]
MACAGLMACGSQHAAPPAASSSSTTKSSTPPSSSAPASPVVSPTTTTPTCVGLSICPPPPPDAEGNPACYYADGWHADDSGAGIEVWYFHDPKSPPKPEKVTALVRKKDGTSESQDADIEAGQQVHRFGFPTVAPSTVQEVFFTSSSGRCFVIGPGG